MDTRLPVAAWAGTHACTDCGATCYAPAGVTFSAPATKAAGLVIGDIPAGSAKAIWFRRTAANSAAIDNDGVTLNIAGDTTA